MNIKPPYKVPSMQEIKALQPNGYKVASTFSGAGGSCLGYRMAGYKVLYANEFIPEAQNTYVANHPESYLDRRDIREIQPSEMLDIMKLKVGELDLFDGSPPCASFSTAGNREKDWGKLKQYSDTKQRTDDLFYEYIRIMNGLQPKVFVAENVSGLVKGAAKGYFKEILLAMKKCGYNVGAKVLDASWLGVPQKRQRLIFIGVRQDLERQPVFPKPLPYYYTVRDAWQGLEDTGPSFEGYAIYEASKKTNKRGQSDKYFQLVKLLWNEPANTICSTWGLGVATVIHPQKPVYPSIEQLKRLSAFPDDFLLTGDFKKQWERIGRAVPPVLMSHIAKTIQTEILDTL